jgi:glycosyltransferase involved in cell wall biosynthesis
VKDNIGMTAGIEATQCSPPWVEGLNRMDLNLVSSNFSKQVFQQTGYSQNNKQGQVIGNLKCEKPLDVLFEGVDLDVYNQENTPKLLDIKESFAFLVAGHWLNGDFGEDRKNIGKTIKVFFETFKNMKNPPALVLKTGSDGSIMEQEELIKKTNSVREMVKGKLPPLYILSGNLSDQEMNALYRDPKIKVMVSFTKGEGFGRPLAEFALTKKPIICSNWSGHTDFIKPEFAVLLGGELKDIHKSAVWKDVLMGEAKWFNVDEKIASKALKDIWKNYKNYIVNSRKSRQHIKDHFSYEKMKEKLNNILENNVKIQSPLNLPNNNQSKLQLPKLKKIGGETKPELPKLKLPKLKKLTV